MRIPDNYKVLFIQGGGYRCSSRHGGHGTS